ncbi:MAG: hypothetical protein ACK4NR_00005 [Micavibrio sp.]
MSDYSVRIGDLIFFVEAPVTDHGTQQDRDAVYQELQRMSKNPEYQKLYTNLGYYAEGIPNKTVVVRIDNQYGVPADTSLWSTNPSVSQSNAGTYRPDQAIITVDPSVIERTQYQSADGVLVNPHFGVRL